MYRPFMSRWLAVLIAEQVDEAASRQRPELHSAR